MVFHLKNFFFFNHLLHLLFILIDVINETYAVEPESGYEKSKYDAEQFLWKT